MDCVETWLFIKIKAKAVNMVSAAAEIPLK